MIGCFYSFNLTHLTWAKKNAKQFVGFLEYGKPCKINDSILERLSPHYFIFLSWQIKLWFRKLFFRPRPPNSSLSDFKCLTLALLFLAHSHQSNIVLLILDADPCTVSNCKAIYSDSHQDKIHYLCRRGLHLQTL